MAVFINPFDYGMVNVEAQSNRSAIESDIKKTESFQEVLERAIQEGEKQKIMEACKEFETYFIQMMFKEMRKTIGRDENSLIAKNPAEDYFQEMLDEQYSKTATNTGGIGLATFLYKQLSGDYQVPPSVSSFTVEKIQTDEFI